MKNADAFADCHPTVNIVFFAFVIAFSMFLMHPICLGISLFSSCLYSVRLQGGKAVRLILFTLLPLSLFTAMLNPLFSHRGVTVLAYFPSGNPLTLESIYYGMAAAAMLACIVCWFSAFNIVMTSDKLVFLFGRLVPSLSLVLSMTLRFVPRFIAKAKEVTAVRKCLGMTEKSIIAKIKNGAHIVSIMITWALENAVDTADSMKSRGYGVKRRTAFEIYSFSTRDKWLMAWLSFLGVFILAGVQRGAASWNYFPYISGGELDLYAISVFTAYLALCTTPAVFDCLEDRRWKSLSSAS